MQLWAKRLGENIGCLLSCWYVVDSNLIILNCISNEVISDVDVFRSIVVLRIVDKLLSTLVVN